MSPSRHHSWPGIVRASVLATLGLAALLASGTADAQLRPLDPLPAGVFEPAAPAVDVRLGFGIFADQRASLAGTTGTLAEIGNLRGTWRTGRVVLEVGGTVLRRFEDESRFTAPHESVDPAAGPRRTDAGDYRIATAVRLTPLRWPVTGFVRFGTRLPTTDNTVGLDRDRTDFFATLGGHAAPGRWRLGAEAGVAILGTLHHRLEQSDVLTYAAAAEYELGSLVPGAAVVGHADGMPGAAIRGSEELAELRVGVRSAGRLGLAAHWVVGLTEFSPRGGLLVSAGWTFQ